MHKIKRKKDRTYHIVGNVVVCNAMQSSHKMDIFRFLVCVCVFRFIKGKFSILNDMFYWSQAI